MNKKINQYLYQGFEFFYHCFLTRRYVGKLRHFYELMKPTDEYTIGICTMKLILKSMVISFLLLFYTLRLKDSSIYNYCMILTLGYLFAHQIIMNGIEKEELKIIKQFEKYLGEVRHYFHANGTVEEAIYDSLEESNYEISLHINRIYDILTEGDDYEISNYREIAPNKYLVTFLALCQTTIVYGDTIQDGKSLFLSNLNHLKNEINTEILKRDKMKHIFSGLIFISILPVFFLKSIEHWGISNLPILEEYYKGGYGIIVSVLIFLSTLLSYRIICYLKTNMVFGLSDHVHLEKLSRLKSMNQYILYWCNNHPIRAKKVNELVKKVGDGITLRQFITQKALIFICSFLLLNIIVFNILVVSRWNTIHYVGDFIGTSFTEESGQILEYQDIIEEYTDQYKNQSSLQRNGLLNHANLDKEYFALTELIKAENNHINTNTINILVEEIKDRIQEYHRYKYHWYYLLFTGSLSMFLGSTPYLLLSCKKLFQNMSMEDEVLQFHSIIIMLMYLPKMNATIILEWLENFSEIFRSSIMECVDNYTYDEDMALNKLKVNEPFLPFTRIIQNLEACDRVGVEKAFDELAGQRSYYIEKRKQDNEILLTNKGVFGKVIAYIPLFLTISLYLIIPFVLESIKMFISYVTQINSI